MFEGVCLLVLFFCLYYEDVCLIDGTPLPFEIGCLLNFTFDGILISVFDVAAVVLVYTPYIYMNNQRFCLLVLDVEEEI